MIFKLCTEESHINCNLKRKLSHLLSDDIFDWLSIKNLQFKTAYTVQNIKIVNISQ